MATQSPRPVVAVLGLGIMGSAFARNLAKAGFEVHVWNRSPEPARALQAAGARVHADAAGAAAPADVVLCVLTTAEVSRGVILGEVAGDAPAPASVAAALRPGSALLQMGTIGIDGTQALARALQAARPDVFFVDAPISGSKGPAENAAVTILASSDTLGSSAPQPVRGARAEAADAAVAQVLEAISRATVWLGGAGAGTRMKLVVNAWLVAVMQGVAETAVLARALGFDAGQVWAALEGGPLAAPYVKAKLAKIGAQDFSTEMALKWGAKDAGLALQAYRQSAPAELELPVIAQIATLWQAGAEAGYAERDISSMYAYLLGEPADGRPA
ncbi:NAD(P)-dependent oxidoreductase [Stenotrophomonas sp. MMGLT7]|uniref:NAD(P)-dependent oxidoreductase n=1 Tax=Stenotrophomonas sp. MMGLT7 TaxID=2901227 RepID=UPI001E65BE32|nr:NAD(P)-dependent oxidoreductase [Stenotrophomonas sp. MMGLT7]MCD7098183.1 NAD(P)-dependent oxidoreductase [Stenotrophomonas sp. MMGLT7]